MAASGSGRRRLRRVPRFRSVAYVRAARSRFQFVRGLPHTQWYQYD